MRYDETGIPETYDAGREFEPAAREAWIADLHQRLGAPPKRSLDVGCGTGRFTLTLRRAFPSIAQLVGMDASRLMLEQAARKLDLEHVPLVRGLAESLPFASGSFDLVVISMVYHQLRSASAALREVRRVLDPGGRLYVRSPTQESFRGCPWAAAFPRAAAIAHRTLPHRGQLLSEIPPLDFA